MIKGTIIIIVIHVLFVHKYSGSGSITVKQVKGRTGESRDDCGIGVCMADLA